LTPQEVEDEMEEDTILEPNDFDGDESEELEGP